MEPDGLEDVATLLRRYRRQAMLTQEELADKAGISPRGLSDLERGVRRRPHKDTLQLLADALGLTPSERQALLTARASGAPGPQHSPAGDSLSNGTVTILLAQIVDESSSPALPWGAPRHECARLLDAASEAHHGRVFSGDHGNFCAAFPTAPNALRAVLDALVASDSRFTLRSALHTGLVEIQESTCRGLTLVQAGQLLATARDGEILLSSATARLVRDVLPSGVTLRNHGSHHLPDSGWTETVFQLVKADSKQAQTLASLPGDDISHSIINPYKGLRPFHERDAPDFYGREALTARLLARLIEDGPGGRFLAVVGPSGSGKSSVVRAGLLAALNMNALPGSAYWPVVAMTPGEHPLEELEAGLLRVAVNPPGSLLEQLRGERGLSRAIKRVLPDDPQIELVLLIDQFEELFTLSSDEAECAHFVSLLRAALADSTSRLRIICTLRADYYDRPLLDPELGKLFRERTELVLPLTTDELARAIGEPARRAGVVLEPALVSAILVDVDEQPGALPLLQFALTELFDGRAGPLLTLEAYREAGGIRGALTRRAEELCARLTSAEVAVLRQLMLRLVTVGDSADDGHRRVPLAELQALDADSGTVTGVLELFGRYRLLTFDREPATGEPTVELAHEALTRAWPRFRGWIEQSRDALRLQRRLAADAAEWIWADRDAGFLASGGRLAQFETLAGSRDVALNASEQAYVDASLSERDRQRITERGRQSRELESTRQRERAQRAAARRLRYLAVTLTTFLILASALIVVSTRSRAAAEAAFDESESQRLAADASGVLQGGESAELAALLAMRGLQARYSPQADIALQQASRSDFGQRLFVAPGQVGPVAFSPDGQYALIGSQDGAARLWEVATSHLVRVFGGHAAMVGAIAFSPDGRLILTGSSDHTLLWERESGRVIQSLPGSNSLAFSPDGRTVFLQSSNDAAIWDVQSGRSLRQFPDLANGRVQTNAAFSPDGKYLLLGLSDGTAGLWDAETGVMVQRFQGHTGALSHVAFSPDGKSVLTSSWDKTARLWSVATGQELQRFIGTPQTVSGIAVSPDGSLVVTGGFDATVRLWDARSGQVIRTLTGLTSAVSGVAFSPDGRYVLAGGSYEKAALLWDLTKPAEQGTFGGAGGYQYVSLFSPDGATVLTGGISQPTRLWDISTGQEIRRFDDSASAAAFSQDGTMIFIGDFDGVTHLRDFRTGTEVRRFAAEGSESRLAGGVATVAVSADGHVLLTSYYAGTMSDLWDARTGEHLRSIPQTGVAAISADGRYVAVTNNVGATITDVTVWDTQSGHQVHGLPQRDGATAVAFSHDGRYLATVDRGDWNLTLWNTRTWKAVHILSGHTTRVSVLAFSPDDRYLLSGSQDKTARLWDVATGRELRRYPAHGGSATSAGFSPGGRAVVIGSNDGTAQIADVSLDTLLGAVCSRVLRDFSPEERTVYNIRNLRPTCAK